MTTPDEFSQKVKSHGHGAVSAKQYTKDRTLENWPKNKFEICECMNRYKDRPEKTTLR